MPDPLAHVYDLALRALAEQERQVTALHGRLAPVLAASGLAATLLAPPAFRGERPAGAVATVGVVIGLVGTVVAVLAAGYVLVPRHFRFGMASREALAVARAPGLESARDFYASMVVLLDERRAKNSAVIRRLDLAFTVILCGMLIALCGLLLAAAVA
jgi:hypothetical protein